MTSLTLPISVPAPRRRPPWYLLAPAAVAALGTLLPLAYLVIRALELEPAAIAESLFRWRTATLLFQTLGLAAAVLTTSTVIALPLAWLTTWTDLPCRRLLGVLAVMPLAMPGYLVAYALLSVGGDIGAAAVLTGYSIPRPSGFLGALLALTITTYPYMYLNLRGSLQELPGSLVESARTLGGTPANLILTVVLPYLRPALLSGSMLVGMHVLADFGVVSLMRFETFSLALYDARLDRPGAALLGLILVAVAGALVVIDAVLLARVTRGAVQSTHANAGRRRPVRLGAMALPAWCAVAALVFVSLIGPVATMIFWAARSTLVSGAVPPHWPLDATPQQLATDHLVGAIRDSLWASVPAAVISVMLAMPLAYAAARYPSRRAFLAERLTFLGYAIPPMAFALGAIFFTLPLDVALSNLGLPRGLVYQTLGVLVFAYAIRFQAEAVGTIRSSVHSGLSRLEEASRTLGRGRFATFCLVVFPMLRHGMIVGLALVFLSAMKELPLAVLLSPPEFRPLALNVWDYTNEGNFADASPPALAVLVVSFAFVGVLLYGARKS